MRKLRHPTRRGRHEDQLPKEAMEVQNPYWGAYISRRLQESVQQIQREGTEAEGRQWFSRQFDLWNRPL